MVGDCQKSREDFKEMKYGWSRRWKTFKRSRIVQPTCGKFYGAYYFISFPWTIMPIENNKIIMTIQLKSLSILFTMEKQPLLSMFSIMVGQRKYFL